MVEGSEIESVFREEYGRAVAVLVRAFGDIDIAEEAVQDAFTVAVQRWPDTGLPPSPAGWIITTARNRAIDRLRREASGGERPHHPGLRRALADRDRLGRHQQRDGIGDHRHEEHRREGPAIPEGIDQLLLVDDPGRPHAPTSARKASSRSRRSPRTSAGVPLATTSPL